VPTFKEWRQNYNGPVEIWVNGAKRMDANVRLSSYIDVEMINTLGEPEQRHESQTSWNGRLDGLSDHELMALNGQSFELRFPDGRMGEAMLLDASGRLQGFDVVPFD
jgi:hypothetical protein